MSNKLYDILVYIAQIVLPALSVLIIAIFKIWDIPYGEAIGATIMAVDTFMGALLKISSIQYHSNIKEDNNGDNIG